jgi:hypothetical protein
MVAKRDLGVQGEKSERKEHTSAEGDNCLRSTPRAEAGEEKWLDLWGKIERGRPSPLGLVTCSTLICRCRPLYERQIELGDLQDVC